MAATPTTKMTTELGKTRDIGQLLEPYRTRLNVLSCLPDVDGKTVIAAMTVCADANPLLYDCSPESWRNAAMLAAQTGLLPSTGTKAKAYLVPRRKNNVWEVYYTIGAWGFYQLALQSGFVKSVWWDNVYEGDEFRDVKGLHRDLVHVAGPNYGTDPKLITHTYCCFETVTGGLGYSVFTRGQIERYRLMNDAEKKGSFSPWQSHYAEMSVAKAVRQTIAPLPHSRQMQVALAVDDAETTGDSKHFAPFIDAEFREEQKQPSAKNGTEQLKAKIGNPEARAKVHTWASSVFGPDADINLAELGMDEKEAADWASAGVTPEQALMAVSDQDSLEGVRDIFQEATS